MSDNSSSNNSKNSEEARVGNGNIFKKIDSYKTQNDRPASGLGSKGLQRTSGLNNLKLGSRN